MVTEGFIEATKKHLPPGILGDIYFGPETTTGRNKEILTIVLTPWGSILCIKVPESIPETPKDFALRIAQVRNQVIRNQQKDHLENGWPPPIGGQIIEMYKQLKLNLK